MTESNVKIYETTDYDMFKKMLKDALKHGKEIEGVSIVEKQSVQVR